MGRKVLITTSSFGRGGRGPLELLEAAGCSYRLNPFGRRLESAELLALLSGVEGIIAGTERLDRPVLEAAAHLRVISRCGAGVDNIDLDAARSLGIAVRSTPDALTDAVAELALGGMLALLRRLCAADRSVRAGEWSKPMGRLLRGKRVGIVGLGRIGRRLVELLVPFEVEVSACDPVEDEELARRFGISYLTLDELLAASDIVSLHLAAPGDAEPLLDARALRSMKPGALLLNCARGALVDEEALREGLEEGHLGGAFLDVFGNEPYQGPLTETPNLILSPHMGSYAAESRLQMETEAVSNLLEVFRQEAPG